MKAFYVQKGDSIDYVPQTDVSAGDVVVVGNLVAVAKSDISANTLGALSTVGVFDVEKDNSNITIGDAVYWDATNGKATTDVDNPYFGVAIADSGTTVGLARVLLRNGGAPAVDSGSAS